MHQGVSTQGGAARRPTALPPPPARGAEENPRRRRRRSKARKRNRASSRRNPSATTWILLAGGVAALTGAGLGIYAWRRKKAELPPIAPPSGGGGARPGGGGSRPGGGGSAQAAPPFPYSVSDARGLEPAMATAEVAEEIAAANGARITRSIDAITDDAFYQMYNIRKIPAGGGASWQPYIDSWFRLRSLVTDQVNAYNSAAVS